MLSSDAPEKIQVPFADAGQRRAIPVPSQVSITPGAASYETGFPPKTMTPLSDGGIPPDGLDMNGALYDVTNIQRWQSAGGLFKFDAAFAAEIGGYPKGATLLGADGANIWFNTVESSVVDPDGVGVTGWVSINKFIQSGSGMVPRTFQDKNRDTYSVKDAGAIGDGAANELSALQIAAANLTSNMELDFPPGRYKLAWSGAKPEKSTIALDLFQLSNVKINGHGSTIVITNHDVGLYGGLLFCRMRACKNVEIFGFNVEMSFVGTNTSAAHYPESGFLYAYNTTENAVSWPVPLADRLMNINVHDITFDIRSQYGAYSTSPNPYMGDNNNGGKYYSVFIRGEQAEQNYASQNRDCRVYDINFLESHQGYGVWVWGFSNADIYRITADAWAPRTADYLNVTLGGSVPAIRCHKFFTRNWSIEDCTLVSRDPALRVGSNNGGAALISFQQEATAFNAASSVYIGRCKLTVGSNSDGSIMDTGMQILAGGVYTLDSNEISCNAAVAGGNAIQVNDATSCAGLTQYVTVTGTQYDPSCEKLYGVAYSSASNVSAADRSIKSLVVTKNVSNGYYRSLVSRAVQGRTFEGVAYQDVSNNAINGAANTTVPPANVNNIPIDMYVEQAGDQARANGNNISTCYIGIRGAGPSIANLTASTNDVKGAVLKATSGVANYSPNSTPTIATFISAAPVVVTGSPNKLFGCLGLALGPTGLVLDRLAGTYAGGTTLVNAPTGFTWQLFQWEVGDGA